MQNVTSASHIDLAEVAWVNASGVHDAKINISHTQVQIITSHTVSFGLLYGRTETAPLVIWFLVTIVLWILRWSYLKEYKQKNPSPPQTVPHHILDWYGFITLSSACVWGISTYFIFNVMATEPVAAGICMLIVCIHGIFSTHYLSSHARLLTPYLYVYCLSFMLGFGWYLMYESIYVLTLKDLVFFVGIVLVFFVFLQRIGMRLHHTYTETMRLQYRNAQLIQSLTLEREAALTAVATKNRMLASATHDMRQPVLALDLYASWMVDEPSASIDLAPKIVTSTKAVITLFDSLFDMSRLAEGLITTNLEAINLNELMSELDMQFQPIAAAKNLSFKTRITQNIGKKPVFTDYILLQRILGNLISNAIKYTSTGGVLVTSRNSAKGIRFQVWDTGLGISPDQQVLVFNEFYKSPANTGTNDGFGLGLAIVKHLSDLLGYDLSLKSCLGSGTVVSILIKQSTQ